MPVVLIALARFAIQLGIITGAQWVLNKTIFALLDHMRAKVLTAVLASGGYTKEEAEATADQMVQNAWIKGAQDLGVGAALLYAKIPQAATEKMGLTSKGWKALPTVGKSAQAAASLSSTAATGAATATFAIEDIAQVVAKSSGGAFSAINSALSFIAKAVGIPTAVLYMLAQYIDYASWNGSAYQSTFQKILGKVAGTFGVDFQPDKPYPKATAVSSDVFDKLYLVYKEEGVTAINDPYKNKSVPFSRQNLVDLVDKTGAHILALKGAASFKDVLAATQLAMGSTKPGFGFKTSASTSSTGAPTTGGSATTPASSNAPAGAGAGIKIFTGVVSQGTLGAQLSFVSRENDLIESTDELKLSATQNLAPYVAALPGKIAYEVKIVSSIVTKDGFRQYGSTQRVQTGTYSNGQPRYKSVTNKFAQLTLYFIQQGGKRLKLDTITLGPTDAIKLQPSTTELAALESSIQGNLFTSDINQITGIRTNQPLTIGATVQMALVEQSTAGTPPTSNSSVKLVTWSELTNATLDQVNADPRLQKAFIALYGGDVTWATMYSYYKSGQRSFASDMGYITGKSLSDGLRGIEENITAYQNFKDGNALDQANAQTRLAEAKESLSKAIALWSAAGLDIWTQPRYAQYLSVAGYTWNNATGPLAGSAAGTNTQTLPMGACLATTLSAYYTALGQNLPTVAERAKLYADLGLGPVAYYAGTAEQNAKLLAALQRQGGCKI